MPLIRVIIVCGLALAAGALAGPAAAEPSFAAAPVIRGDAAVGIALAVDPLRVAGATGDDVSLTWERSTAAGYAAIDGAHDVAYIPTGADAGRRLRVHATVETSDGTAEAWSEATGEVRAAAARRVRIGPAAGAAVALARWTVTAGDAVDVRGRLPAALALADARLVLVPTVPAIPASTFVASVDALGRVRAVVEPQANAVVWLEVAARDGSTERLRLGVVGVRPRIDLVLAASPDGRDGAGHRLIRDLRLLAGSAILPARRGIRLTWEGRLPGEREGTAVCRTAERVVSRAGGALRGGCRTRGAWSAARWRLVADPGGSDPGSTAYLPAASAWVAARIAPARRW